MNIADVQIVSAQKGTKVVPPTSDYAASSDTWNEKEYRVRLEQSSTIAGFWEGEPGWVRIDSWPYNELCVILSGEHAIEDEQGNRLKFGPGDSFLVPIGFSGTWHTITQGSKVFVGISSDLSSG